MMRKKRRLSLAGRRNLLGLAFITPWLLGFSFFFAYPLIQSAIYSLSNIVLTANGRKQSFIGGTNYTDIFTRDIYFTDRLTRFFLNTLYSLPVIIFFSLMIAIFINQPIRGKGLFRTVFFLPIIVVSGPVLTMLMEEGATTVPIIEQYGLYSFIEGMPYFLMEPLSFLFSQLIMILWYSGVPILIFLAGLQKIDKGLYEAALIDGASAWVAFWKITLPALRDMMLINVIYTLVFLANSEVNEVIALIRSSMMSPDRGYGIAAAMAWSYSICILLALALCYIVIGKEKKRVEKHAYVTQRRRRYANGKH